jgi:flagellar basal-body rod modification protein FlgD
VSTTPINAIGSTAGASTALDRPTTTIDHPGAMLDRDAFLKLLVAQLKYQDPTKPADASQMVAQSAQLTMVDRLNDIATQLRAGSESDRLGLASSIVGKQVTFQDDQGFRRTAEVTAATIGPDQLTLIAGGFAVPIAAVTAISEPASATLTL